MNIPGPSPEEGHVADILFFTLRLLVVTSLCLLMCSTAWSFLVCLSMLDLNLLCIVYFTYLGTCGVVFFFKSLCGFYTGFTQVSTLHFCDDC